MLVSVTLHRANGLQLTAAEVDPPVIGDLQMGLAKTTSQKRLAQGMANLYAVSGAMPYQRILLTPLFDPRVDRIEGDTLVIVGTELASQGRRLEEHIQVWACTPATSDQVEDFVPRPTPQQEAKVIKGHA